MNQSNNSKYKLKTIQTNKVTNQTIKNNNNETNANTTNLKANATEQATNKGFHQIITEQSGRGKDQDIKETN